MKKILLLLTITISTIWSQSPTANILFERCAACHGRYGDIKALEKSEIIAGQTSESLFKKLKEYKAGTRNMANFGAIMKDAVSKISDEQLRVLSVYISQMPKQQN